MLKTSFPWLLAAFLASFLATGAMHWPLPYAQVALPNSLYGYGLLVVALSAGALRLSRKRGFWISVLATGTAVPAAIMARVMVETGMDPTSHNLWPFEIVIGMALGSGVAFGGALAGAAAGYLGAAIRGRGRD